MANFEQSGSQIPDAWSVILIFSLITTFDLAIDGCSSKQVFVNEIAGMSPTTLLKKRF